MLTQHAPELTKRKFSALISFGAVLGLAFTSLAAPASAQETNQEILSETASFEFPINLSYQEASANGACSVFSAGIADGTDSQWKPQLGNVSILKRSIQDEAFLADLSNRCTQIEPNNAKQSALFSNGKAIKEADGTVEITWDGSFTAYAYGGLVPWSITDPVLNINTDGTAEITADVGGYAANMANPNEKTLLPTESDLTILDLSDVTISADGSINATPIYAGVDYYPLIDANNPDSGRRSTSAVTKTATDWGSWPQDLVDFHYRTGLSTYWHSSGGSADPEKPPLPVRLSLNPTDFDSTIDEITITKPIGSISAYENDDVELSIEASTTSGKPLTYQWQRREGTTWVDIEGATGPTLSLTDIPYETIQYRVIIGNGSQSIESPVGAVSASPDALVFTTQPRDGIYTVDSTVARFTARAEGRDSDIEYRWQTRKTEDASWEYVNDWSTTRRLTLTADNSVNGDYFRSEARNASGQSAFSESARIYVISGELPDSVEVTQQPQNILATLAGPEISTSIVVDDHGVPRNVTYKWEKWNEETAAWVPDDSKATATFSTPATAEQRDARWRVKVTEQHNNINNRGTALGSFYSEEITVTLVDGPAPEFTNQINELSALSGEEITITPDLANATGATFQWQRSTDGQQWEDITGATNASYTFSPTIADDGILLRLIADNGAPSEPTINLGAETDTRVFSASITVNVVEPATETDLNDDNKGQLIIPESLVEATEVTVNIGLIHAGKTVDAVIYPAAQKIESIEVDGSGKATFTLPLGTSGDQTIAFYNSGLGGAANVLGWELITIDKTGIVTGSTVLDSIWEILSSIFSGIFSTLGWLGKSIKQFFS